MPTNIGKVKSHTVLINGSQKSWKRWDPNKFRTWVMGCVTLVSYSIIINGKVHEAIFVVKGLRQGGLMSLYFFASRIENGVFIKASA